MFRSRYLEDVRGHRGHGLRHRGEVRVSLPPPAPTAAAPLAPPRLRLRLRLSSPCHSCRSANPRRSAGLGEVHAGLLTAGASRPQDRDPRGREESGDDERRVRALRVHPGRDQHGAAASLPRAFARAFISAPGAFAAPRPAWQGVFARVKEFREGQRVYGRANELPPDAWACCVRSCGGRWRRAPAPASQAPPRRATQSLTPTTMSTRSTTWTQVQSTA